MTDTATPGAGAADVLTVLHSAGPRLAKLWHADGTIDGYEDARQVRVQELPVRDIASLARALRSLEDNPRACVVRGRFVGHEAAEPLYEAELARDRRRGKPGERPRRGWTLRRLAFFDDRPSHALILDIDGYRPALYDPVTEPAGAVEEYVHEHLPPAFAGASCYWQLSGSAGHAAHDGVLKAHVAWWLREPLPADVLIAWCESLGRPFDPACLRIVQPIYTATPLFEPGANDPVPAGRRSGFVEGLLGDDVPLTVPASVLIEAARRRGATADGQGADGAEGSARAMLDPRTKGGLVGLFHRLFDVEDVIERWLSDAFAWADGGAAAGGGGGAGGAGGAGEGGVEGWRLHYLRSASGAPEGAVVCADRMHVYNSHASDPAGNRALNLWDLVRVHQFGHLDAALDPAERELLGPGGWPSEAAMREMVEALPEVRDERRREHEVSIRQAIAAGRGSIPEARHLITDQANAGRILAAFGRRLIVVADQWYSWSGVRWERDEGEVYRCACLLSRIIHEEAASWRTRSAASTEERDRNAAVAKALESWALRSEMRGTIDAALALAKKMLAVDASLVDRDPWLLNCTNGTVDLRTGALKDHDAEDYITRLAPVEYDPAATAGLWEHTLRQITREQDSVAAPLAEFLQRWFGYCATGSTREQQFLVHYGGGSNGKSTVLDTIAAVLGDYAATAAPGLMVSANKERHPTEIADLMGRRMVTAHESGDDGVLREDFVKQATGSDRLKARWMRGDFFEFQPTHKLQLVTNYRPRIRGQDTGIWRRVLLCPYMARFGTEQEVREGAAEYVKDRTTQERLQQEWPGVLAWIVEGARQWYEHGLRPPPVVLEATRRYQTDQDRVQAFISECCELGPELRAPIRGEFGLYATYVAWCRDNGTRALSKPRLLQELERFVPSMGRDAAKEAAGEAGTRTTVRYVTGLGLVGEV